MTHDNIVYVLNQTLVIVLWTSVPVLGVALTVGLVVGLLQAVTQVQDQSLPQAAKIVAVLLTLALFGPVIYGQLAQHARQILDRFPELTR